MQRARRLAASVMIAACAVGAVAGCRSEPGVAAYVADGTITEDQVNALYEDARTKLAEAVAKVRAEQQAADPNAAPQPPVELSIDRAQVLTTLVGLDVLRSIAQQRGIKPAAVPAEQVAQSLQLPPDADYVGTYAEYRGYLDAFAEGVPPAQVTDAELRDVYARLRDGGGLGPQGASFEDFRSSLSAEDQQVLQQNIGLRNQLNVAARDVDVRVNPRYGNAELDLVSFRSSDGKPMPLVVMSFEQQVAEPAVTDLP